MCVPRRKNVVSTVLSFFFFFFLCWVKRLTCVEIQTVDESCPRQKLILRQGQNNSSQQMLPVCSFGLQSWLYSCQWVFHPQWPRAWANAPSTRLSKYTSLKLWGTYKWISNVSRALVLCKDLSSEEGEKVKKQLRMDCMPQYKTGAIQLPEENRICSRCWTEDFLGYKKR